MMGIENKNKKKKQCRKAIQFCSCRNEKSAFWALSRVSTAGVFFVLVVAGRVENNNKQHQWKATGYFLRDPSCCFFCGILSLKMGYFDVHWTDQISGCDQQCIWCFLIKKDATNDGGAGQTFVEQEAHGRGWLVGWPLNSCCPPIWQSKKALFWYWLINLNGVMWFRRVKEVDVEGGC